MKKRAAKGALVRNSEYEAFLASKLERFEPIGFEPATPICDILFDFQLDIVRWSIRRGRAAIFAACGLGKTFIQLEWARHVSAHTGLPVLILAPLAVNVQTQGEGAKLGIEVTLCESSVDIRPGINITNYEKLHHFTADGIGGIVLDESSILKALDGKTRKAITEFARGINYRLCCTATPAPNDYMELGNHAEFLGVMTQAEMLAMFFVHDGGDTSKWRLKKHAESEFWKWICSWAVAIRRPSDLGYPDERFILPELHIHQVAVESFARDGALFPVEARTLNERRGARKDSLDARVKAAADLVAAEPVEQWIAWCDLNVESEALTKAITGAVEITGSQSNDFKIKAMTDFIGMRLNRVVTKPSIFGWGSNIQSCARMIFVGLSDSFEQFYQAVRRCWRFGQLREVHAYVVTSEAEGAVVRNIERKQRQAEEMMEGMVQHMKNEMQKQVKGAAREVAKYERRVEQSGNWRIHLGDCVEVLRDIPTDSIDYSVFSPPFSSLYTYSNSERDLGNCTDYRVFKEHFKFVVRELYRVLKPGRLISFHCMNLPVSKERDGFIGVKDFRGKLIRMFECCKRCGADDATECTCAKGPLDSFIFHSEVCIWKDPVTAMQRTKAIGLLYKQLRKDSAMSRQGIADHLVTVRKPGINTDPIAHVAPPAGSTFSHARNVPENEYSVDHWQNVASPVWMDIEQSRTLVREAAREQADERHICALQLPVIERALELWTNRGDLVLSPFAGIGSEGYSALRMGRRFVGIELKESYWKQAVRNLSAAEKNQQVDMNLFEVEDPEE